MIVFRTQSGKLRVQKSVLVFKAPLSVFKVTVSFTDHPKGCDPVPGFLDFLGEVPCPLSLVQPNKP